MLPVMLGGCLMLIDNLWGGIAVLPFDWSQLPEMTLGISFVIGLPCYLLDARSGKRMILFLPVLFALRWFALTLEGPHPSFFIPWRVNGLLIPASILLQWSKLRNPAAVNGPSTRPSA